MRELNHGRPSSPRLVSPADETDGPSVKQQETDMNTQILSDGALDAVSGGMINIKQEGLVKVAGATGPTGPGGKPANDSDSYWLIGGLTGLALIIGIGLG
jgi:hypothetical protein